MVEPSGYGPDHPRALHDAGLAAHRRGDHARAIELMGQAAAARPDLAELRNSLAVALGAAGRVADALAQFDEAIRIKRDYADAHSNRGVVLDRLGDVEEAAAAWARALAIDPDHAAARSHLGASLIRRGMAVQAAVHLRQATRLAPNSADAHNNLGAALRDAGDLPAAIIEFRKAIDLQSDHPEAIGNLGSTMNDLGRPHDAIPLLRQAIELKPDFADAHMNLALALLATGDFNQGWREYEWRKRHPDWQGASTFAQPAWNGCSLSGATILVVCEQGLGDALQFVRFLPPLKQRGATVALGCPRSLVSIMRGVAGADRVVGSGDALPRFDLHVSLLSVPGILGIGQETIPARVPYLRVDESRASRWDRLLAGDEFKVGIAWQGIARTAFDRTRAIPLSAFVPVADVAGVRLFSLQKGRGTEDVPAMKGRLRLIEFDPPLDESGDGGGGGAFLDTAAVMRRLDLVVTNDTSIAHLAGGLAIPVWVALAKAADWRWLLDREDSPWYPTMRLFRQATAGDWPAVFSRIATALGELVAARRGRGVSGR